MKPRSLLVLCAVLFSVHAIAQQPDRFQFFGGFSDTRFSVYDKYSGPWETFHFTGWEASATAKLLPSLGAEADFAGGYSSPYGTSGSIQSYLFGPRVFANVSRATLYGHVLLGGLGFGYGPTTRSFATALGGGADLWVTRHIGAQIVQVDYLYNKNSGATQGLATTSSSNHFRISTGVVFRFGR